MGGDFHVGLRDLTGGGTNSSGFPATESSEPTDNCSVSADAFSSGRRAGMGLFRYETAQGKPKQRGPAGLLSQDDLVALDRHRDSYLDDRLGRVVYAARAWDSGCLAADAIMGLVDPRGSGHALLPRATGAPGRASEAEVRESPLSGAAPV